MLFQEQADGTVLSVRILPRASKSRIDGVVDDALRIRIAAPPVDGAANSALIALLAKELDVSKSRVVIIAGERARRKRVFLQGLDAAQIRQRLKLC